MNNEIPRRNRLDLNERAELAIYNAMQEVEKMWPDPRLTEAVILLGKAKEMVSNFIDNVPIFPSSYPVKEQEEAVGWEGDEKVTLTKDDLTQKITEGILMFIDERVEDGTISKATGKKLEERFANL